MVGSETVVSFDISLEQNVDFDWDSIIHGDDLSFAPGGEGVSNSSPSSLPLLIGDIEEILMKDDDTALVTGEGHEQNLDFDWGSILLDSPDEASDRSREVFGASGSKGSSGSGVEDNDKVKEGDTVERVDPIQQKVDKAAELPDDDNGDPVSKKLKRQLRNRDAAVRSRERKKMYVRDLEMKSKYFESECKRLGVMLQCCLAENQALRFSLQSSKAVGASTPRQESAVLLLESLLLGSLLWFLGIICLFVPPPQLRSTQENENRASPAPGRNTIRTSAIQSLIGKRYKASRSRIKFQFCSCTSVCRFFIVNPIGMFG